MEKLPKSLRDKKTSKRPKTIEGVKSSKVSKAKSTKTIVSTTVISYVQVSISGTCACTDALLSVFRASVASAYGVPESDVTITDCVPVCATRLRSLYVSSVSRLLQGSSVVIKYRVPVEVPVGENPQDPPLQVVASNFVENALSEATLAKVIVESMVGSTIPVDTFSFEPSSTPSKLPSSLPSSKPSSSLLPSSSPSDEPSINPSLKPSSLPSAIPSSSPSDKPSMNPSTQPSSFPSSMPSDKPSMNPSSNPSCK